MSGSAAAGTIPPADAGVGLDLPRLLRRAAHCFPGAPAVTDRRGTRTLAEVVDRAERLSNALTRLGVPRGATVAILSENRVEYPEVDAGIVLGGRVRLALNVRLHVEDHRHVFGDADVRVLIHSGRFEDEAARLVEASGALALNLDPPAEGSSSRSYAELVDAASGQSAIYPSDAELPAWITYTSGTTGRPKGVVLSHRAIREVAFNLLLELGPVEHGEILTLTQPLSHGSGYFVLPYLISGAGIHVNDRFDPELVVELSTRAEHRTLKVVPAMLPPILDASEGRDFDYSTVIYGASPIARPTLNAGLERFGPVFAQVYGQSEAPVTLTYMHKQDHVEDGPRRASAGRPFRSVGIEIWDEDDRPVATGEAGEVVVTGSNLMSGYRGLPEATAEVVKGGWLRTRDMGQIDERGFVYLLGRSDEMINSGGFNIAPREVELVLSEHPDVEEVAVIGLSDPRWGEAVSAVIRCRQGARTTAESVLEYAKPRLGMRAPKRIAIVDEIGKTPYGKVDRGKLRAAFDADGDGTPAPSEAPR